MILTKKTSLLWAGYGSIYARDLEVNEVREREDVGEAVPERNVGEGNDLENLGRQTEHESTGRKGTTHCE